MKIFISIYIYKTFHQNTAEYTFFFSSAHGAFSMIYHILGQKTGINKI